MKKIFTTHDTGDNEGDFSITFGDLVFGLLFFFFILSLVMVFYRPDVNKFQDAIDKEIRKQTEKQKKIELLEQKLLEQPNEAENLVKQIDKLAEKLKKIRKQLHQLKKENQQLTRENSKLQQRPNNDYYRELVEAREKIEQLTEAYNVSVEESRKETNKSNVKIKKLSQLRDSIKEYLEENELLEVLADVEKMEKKLEGIGDEGKEQEPLKAYKIYVKLYGAEDFEVKAKKGDSEIYKKPRATSQEIIDLAIDIQKEYKQEAASFTEAEKLKFRPRLYIMTHPEIPYGITENFLKKAGKTIPLSIMQWRETKKE